jgi:hypothetical protein
VSPNYAVYATIARAVSAAGFDIGSLWMRSDVGSHHFAPARLSTEQMVGLRTAEIAAIAKADAVVCLFQNSDVRPGSAFWPGYALAKGVPLVLAGPLPQDVALLGMPNHVDLDSADIIAALKKLIAARNALLLLDHPRDLMAVRNQNIADELTRRTMMGAKGLTVPTQTGVRDEADDTDDRATGRGGEDHEGSRDSGGEVHGDGAGI